MMTLPLTRSAVLMLVLLLAFDNFVDVQPRQITRGVSSQSGLLSKWVRASRCSGDSCTGPTDCTRCSCNFGMCLELVR
uniref:Ctr_6_T conopeptide n=2 Tax=Splinoconus TaxID=2056757 RepID=A0A0C9SFL2_CONTD